MTHGNSDIEPASYMTKKSLEKFDSSGEREQLIWVDPQTDEVWLNNHQDGNIITVVNIDNDDICRISYYDDNHLSYTETWENNYLSAKSFFSRNEFLAGNITEAFCYYENGTIEEHWINHPNSNKTSIQRSYYEDGKIAREVYLNEDGRYHNENGPAFKSWYENGNPKTEEYRLNDELRDDIKYPYREWTEDGRLKIDVYKENLHNTLRNSLPIAIVEKIEDYYDEDDEYILEYRDIEELDNNQYYWLVRFDNGSHIPGRMGQRKL